VDAHGQSGVTKPDGALLALDNYLANNDLETPQGCFGGSMATDAHPELTSILARARAGEDGARQEVISKIYEELRHVAARMMHRERASHTLSPTAVVHEAVVRLLGEAVFDRATDRNFLFAAAARAMREILVEHARRRAAARRGGKWERVPLDSVVDYFEAQKIDVSEIHEALLRLTALDERQGQAITLRYFGGLTVAEIASSLEVSVATVERDCRLGRAWLHTQLRDGRGG
jgi:RNA polymerase sigma-70 factor (ECF subfamily)